jgi:polar amino acid transport system permease protein
MTLPEDPAIELPKSEVSAFHRLERRVFLLRSPWRDYILFALLVVAIVWTLSLSSERVGYYWQWYLIPRYIYTIENGHFVAGPLLQGLGMTLQISAISLVLSLLLGLGVALLRLSSSIVGRFLARLYLEITRGMPSLVQIYLWYFVIGPLMGIGRNESALVALTTITASFMSEIFRAGIVSIGKGQWEAAHSVGLSTFDTYRYIILPQALRRVLPPLTSQIITLIKTSSLVSLVSITELTLEARVVASRTFMVFEVWFTVAAIYLVLTVPLSTITNYMEKRFRIVN